MVTADFFHLEQLCFSLPLSMFVCVPIWWLHYVTYKVFRCTVLMMSSNYVRNLRYKKVTRTQTLSSKTYMMMLSVSSLQGAECAGKLTWCEMSREQNNVNEKQPRGEWNATIKFPVYCSSKIISKVCSHYEHWYYLVILIVLPIQPVSQVKWSFMKLSNRTTQN